MSKKKNSVESKGKKLVDYVKQKSSQIKKTVKYDSTFISTGTS